MASRFNSLARNLYREPIVQRAMRQSRKGRDASQVEDYLAAHPVRRLQIGAGKNLRDGWLNTNWYPLEPGGDGTIFLDATERFPLPDASFDYIFSEHMIEHVPYPGGQAMLAECFRVLKSGGTLRIATPDMAFLIDLLKPELSQLQRDYVAWAAEHFLNDGTPATPLAVVNNFVRDWGHVFIYDKATLTECLERTGFTGVKDWAVGESDDAELTGIDHPQRMPEGFLALESMIFQAVKPA